MIDPVTITQIRELSRHPVTSRALGGPLYSEDIERELRNGNVYTSTNLPQRMRVSLGQALYSGETVVGYQVTTILRHATPLADERKYIGLEDSLTYVQGKKLLVHPDFWGSGTSDILILQQLAHAATLQLPYVGDARAENKHILAALKRHGILPVFSWRSRAGTLMLRLRKDF